MRLWPRTGLLAVQPMIAKLPPLPEPTDMLQITWREQREFVQPLSDYYTADQMRAYASAAIASAKEEGYQECLKIFGAHMRGIASLPARKPCGWPATECHLHHPEKRK